MPLNDLIENYRKLAEKFYINAVNGTDKLSVCTKLSYWNNQIVNLVEGKAKRDKKIKATDVKKYQAYIRHATAAKKIDDQAGELHFHSKEVKSFKGLVAASALLKKSTSDYCSLLYNIKTDEALEGTEIKKDAVAAYEQAKTLEYNVDEFDRSFDLV